MLAVTNLEARIYRLGILQRLQENVSAYRRVGVVSEGSGLCLCGALTK
jgi:hypothetical protein